MDTGLRLALPSTLCAHPVAESTSLAKKRPVRRLPAPAFSFTARGMTGPAHEGDNSGEGFRRVLKNIGWLLGGKGFGAGCSLIYLAILSRSLGLKDFGHFSLIFGTAQALVAIAGFQTWQTIVRFGAADVLARKWDRFGRLSVLGGLIDAAGATMGCLMAGAAIYGLSGALELNPAYVDMAFLFSCALLWARVSAPLGVIRVLDRYDLAVGVGAITPGARLLAAIAIWLTGPSVGRFLLAWAVIELSVAALYWVVAWRLRPDALRLSRLKDWRHTVKEHPGIVTFLGITYANTTVVAVLHQGPLLAVGYFLGTSAAGVYRIADQLAQGLSKLATVVAQALYPEVNRQRHGSSLREFRKLVRRVNLLVVGTGVLVVALALLLGEELLVLIGGDDFARGAAVLVPLAIGASFELASVSYEPVLHSTGRASYPLFVRLVGVAALAVGIAALVGAGPVGAGWAVAMASALIYLAMSLTVWLVLRSIVRRGVHA